MKRGAEHQKVDQARQLVASDLCRAFCKVHQRYGITPAEYTHLVRETLERALADAYSTRGRP